MWLVIYGVEMYVCKIYIYICFIKSRGTFPFKYRKMLTEIIFEAYIFKVIVHIITREIIVSLLQYSTNFFGWTVMSCSSCNIRETIDALVLRSFSISFNLLSPMDRYMRWAKAIVLDYRCIYGFGKSYQLDYDSYMCLSIFSITNVV